MGMVAPVIPNDVWQLLLRSKRRASNQIVYTIIGENLFEKRVFPVPFPKNFGRIKKGGHVLLVKTKMTCPFFEGICPQASYQTQKTVQDSFLNSVRFLLSYSVVCDFSFKDITLLHRGLSLC